MFVFTDLLTKPQEAPLENEIIPIQVTNAPPEIKPSLIPMETDVISSEEDDILAHESPESFHKSPQNKEEDIVNVSVHAFTSMGVSVGVL